MGATLTRAESVKQKIANDVIAKQVLHELLANGVEEFCLCPGARNAPLVYPLANSSEVSIYYWPEERSAAFFAVGRMKATGKPVAVVTTSGTASGELLPAVMEAYYTGLPLVLITADRPERFRGSGAPNAAEQVGLFSSYVHEVQDINGETVCDLSHWNRLRPIHLNVCFEEPKDSDCQKITLGQITSSPQKGSSLPLFSEQAEDVYTDFLGKSRFPLVIVGAIVPSQIDEMVQFLQRLGAPVYAEAMSGIREDPRLDHLKIHWMDTPWKSRAEHDYPIDGILRLGSVPTIRLWRDLEHKTGEIAVCSISEVPFSGLSCCGVIYASLSSFFSSVKKIEAPYCYDFSSWKREDERIKKKLELLYAEEPQAEPSLIRDLSTKIPKGSKVYLGNSLPIREWDLSATSNPRSYQIGCNRGVTGIDGQIATFLGFSSPDQENWAIIGDLTALYDLVAPWIASQLVDVMPNLVIVNNGGAGIFARMFAHKAFQNTHALSFASLAEFWGWEYERWESVPEKIAGVKGTKGRIIELVPDNNATERFVRRCKEL